MSHAREQIRDEFIAACTGLTTTGSRVYASRTMPLADGNLPGLTIATGLEQVDQEAGRVARIQERAVEVMVTGYAKLTSGLDDKLDTIAAEVETAVFAGISRSVDLVSIEPEIEDGLEKPVGRIILTFAVQYLTADGAPTSIL